MAGKTLSVLSCRTALREESAIRLSSVDLGLLCGKRFCLANHCRNAIVKVPSIIKTSTTLPRLHSAIPLRLLTLIAAASACLSQTSNAQKPEALKPAAVSNYATLSKVSANAVPNGFDLTVSCTKPVTPGFTRLQNPDRLVVDLPDTLVGSQPSSLAVDNADVKTVRINQFRKSPPVTRIVLDLIGDREYSYEAGGASFVVHLQTSSVAPAPAAAAQDPITRPGPGEGTYGLGLSTGSSNSSPAAVPVSKTSPGSAISAGLDTAVMRLDRGGEIHVCPGTTVSITPTANGRSVMLGMSEGALELHYALASSADTILTPDFRILLPGPGEFHFAISADTKGNTCVRALSGNTASAIVSELIGDGTYQVKPVEQVVFRAGRLGQNDANVPLECGCPPPRQPQLLAAVPAQSGTMQAAAATLPPSQEAGVRPNAPPVDQPLTTQVRGFNPPPSSTQSTPPSKPVQVQVEAPFIFRGDAPPTTDAPPTPPPAITAVPSDVATDAKQPRAKKSKKEKAPPAPKKQKPQPAAQAKPATPVANPPAAQPKPQPKDEQPKRTFFGKVKGFFRSIFK